MYASRFHSLRPRWKSLLNILWERSSNVDLWVRTLDAYGRDRRTDLRRRLATMVHPLRMPRLRPENRRGRAGRTDNRTRGSYDLDRRCAASVGADATLSGSAVPGRDRAGFARTRRTGGDVRRSAAAAKQCAD